MFPSNYLSPIPRQGIPGHSFTYVSPLSAPSPLLLSIPLPPLRYRDKHASYVWNASIVLADMIANEEIQVEGKRVLELGAGVALPGIVAAFKGARTVVLSDFNDSKMLDDLKDSVDEAVVTSERERIQVVGYSFGDSTKSLVDAIAPFSYDVILVADCIWDSHLHQPLLDSLTRLLQASPSSTKVHFTCGFHTGRQVVADFIELAIERALIPFSPMREMSVVGEMRSWEQSRWKEKGKVGEEEKQEERNRWTFVASFVYRRDKS